MALSRIDMEAAAARLERLKAAESAMARAWSDLHACNKLAAEKGKDAGWDTNFTLKASNGYYNSAHTVSVRIPIGVVQQALVTRVMQAERLVVALGGEIDRAKQPKEGK